MTTAFYAIPRAIRVLVPATWSNEKKGEFFETLIARILVAQRWKTTNRVRFTGMEVDVLADHCDTGERAFVQCKFVNETLSANVIDLLLGQAQRRRVSHAYLFSTSELGKEARGVCDEIRQNPNPGSARFAFIGPKDLIEIITTIYPIIAPTPLPVSVTSMTLIVIPNMIPFWAYEEHENGLPKQVTICPHQETTLSLETIQAIFQENNLFAELELRIAGAGAPALTHNATSSEISERGLVVSQVPVADSIEDYRPCRPADFVGRSQIQQEIWSFLDNVRKNETTTRLIALSGPSGYGKSSIVIKLADRFRNKKWCGKFYLFSVDTRSAKHDFFVQAAIVQGIRAAIADGFIPDPQSSFAITTAGNLLSVPGIKQAVQSLAECNRVLVVFFDQFEEILTKDQLKPVFESFRRVAFEINAERPNLVLGFSWRTGITLSDDNPAYHTWCSLSDIRRNIQLNGFSPGESSELITQFEKALGQRLLRPLRRRLEEQAQGIPWLLKKLSIHIYHEIKRSTDQLKLLSQRLNIRSLFDDDLISLSPEEVKCLKYIAENSPADISAVAETFDSSVINRLYDGRLIVKTGYRYAVYWDVFRDYLTDEVIPAIPWAYVPQITMSTSLRVLSQLHESGRVTLTELARRTEYNERTILNVLSDLQNLLLVKRGDDNMYEMLSEIESPDPEKVAVYVAPNMREHIVTRELYKRLSPGESIFYSDFSKLIKQLYGMTDRNDRTLDGYVQRLVAWMSFTGLVELANDRITRPSTGDGKGFGLVQLSRDSPSSIGFMAASSPEQVCNLASKLRRNPLGEKKVPRNACYDLVGMDLAYFGQNETILPHKVLLNTQGDKELVDLVRLRADKSLFMKSYRVAIGSEERLSITEEGSRLGNALGRKWSEGSARRYGGGARRWRQAIDDGYLVSSSKQPVDGRPQLELPA